MDHQSKQQQQQADILPGEVTAHLSWLAQKRSFHKRTSSTMKWFLQAMTILVPLLQ